MLSLPLFAVMDSVAEEAPFVSMPHGQLVRSRSCGRYNMAKKQTLSGKDACSPTRAMVFSVGRLRTARLIQQSVRMKGTLMRPDEKRGQIVDSRWPHTMHKMTIALQVLLCVGSPWAIGVQYARAAEASAPSQDSPPANAGTSNNGSREWRDRLRRLAPGTQGNGLFETKSWLPEAPPPRPVARAPEPPRAPPFPYQFLGRLETEGKPRTVYLTKGDQVYSAAQGEVIEGTYQVLNVTAESMEVTYLPLNMKQQIAFSSIVPPAARQTAGRAASDTPAIVAPTSVSVPPPMNIGPPRADGVQSELVPQTPSGRSPQRQNNPDNPAARQNAPQPQQANTAAAAGGAPAANAGTPAAPPSVGPSPIAISPPTLSAFGSSTPTQPPATNAPQAAGAASAPASSGTSTPSAAPASRM